MLSAQSVSSLSVTIAPHIGVRTIGSKLCLINQRRREIWLCAGISGRIWNSLSAGEAVPAIVESIANRFRVPADKVSRDTLQFVQQLWQRELIEVAGWHRQPEAAEAREAAHNQTGHLYEEALKASVLFRVWLDLLIPCNLRCRHCYLDFSETEVVPLAEVYSRMDQLAEHGCPEIVLTGGEIFLRRDLLDIVAYAQSKGFLFDLYTNGNFIDERKADALARHLVSTVQISVYGTTAAIHESITRKPGTFNKSIRAARLLIERGIPVRLQCHVQQDNFEDAFRFPEFARSLGAEHQFDTKLVPNRDGSKELLRFGVSVGQQAELYRAGLIKRETKFVCTAAASKARINAHGDIYPCELMNTVTLGNLRKESLKEIWASQRRAALRRQILDYKPKRCGGCSHTSDCEPCAAMRGFEQPNHMDAPISESCLLTAASLAAQGRAIPAGVQEFGDDCIAAIQHSDPARALTPLIQIMSARVS
ncbi:MAG: PqqD family peptide modification chaperone [Acidobacteriaceae bacterium]|nr:PqqD family peptide modification chaperone [Acidobacteriaceae bacterium]